MKNDDLIGTGKGPNDDLLGNNGKDLTSNVPYDRIPPMKTIPIKITTISCVKCGYHWSPRIVDPRRCPYCKNIDWNKPYKRKNARRRRD